MAKPIGRKRKRSALVKGLQLLIKDLVKETKKPEFLSFEIEGFPYPDDHELLRLRLKYHNGYPDDKWFCYIRTKNGNWRKYKERE